MIESYINESINLNKRILADSDLLSVIEKMIELISNCLEKGGKIIIAGNGGSAADAQHFAAEIVGRYKKERRGYPAIALTTDSSILTAISNDYGFDFIFARQLEAISQSKDIFFGISTSGNSVNIIKGIEEARKIGSDTLCLLGRDGGKIKSLADLSLVIPSDNTPRIQEMHAMIIHIICEEIEKKFT